MNNHDIHRYDDIIHLPHHVSKSRPQMSMANRAAQFSPFAALTGHNEAVREEARLTVDKPLLNDDAKEILNQKLLIIQEQLDSSTTVEITYYEPDRNKSGGSIQTISGIVKRIDEYKKEVTFLDGHKIMINQILNINI